MSELDVALLKYLNHLNDIDSEDSDDEEKEAPWERLGVDPIECLRLQYAELEMLESMYPEELVQSDPFAIAQFKSVVESLDDMDDEKVKKTLPPNLAFELKLTDIGRAKLTVDLSLHMPSPYPYVKPSVFVRTALPKDSHKRFRDSLDDFLDSQNEGELFVANLIAYVQENVCLFVDMKENSQNCKFQSKSSKNEPLVRMWIYSHHIYSMEKRKFIMEWSRELYLMGFSMPGKPGVVCVEGDEKNVDEFWHRLRKLNWKRLAIKHREVLGLETKNNNSEVSDIDETPDERKPVDKKELMKFSCFEEISFDVKQGQGRNYHMDMGQFLEYLKKHDSENIFKLYFGVDGCN